MSLGIDGASAGATGTGQRIDLRQVLRRYGDPNGACLAHVFVCACTVHVAHNLCIKHGRRFRQNVSSGVVEIWEQCKEH